MQFFFVSSAKSGIFELRDFSCVQTRFLCNYFTDFYEILNIARTKYVLCSDEVRILNFYLCAEIFEVKSKNVKFMDKIISRVKNIIFLFRLQNVFASFSSFLFVPAVSAYIYVRVS